MAKNDAAIFPAPSTVQWVSIRAALRLAFQHIEIVFEIEHLPRTIVAAFMLRDTSIVIPELNQA